MAWDNKLAVQLCRLDISHFHYLLQLTQSAVEQQGQDRSKNEKQNPSSENLNLSEHRNLFKLRFLR